MANVKYLSYDGLKHYDAKIKDYILRGFANGISVEQNNENNIISLSANYTIDNEPITSIIATAQINLATTSKAGLMSKDDKTKIDTITASAEPNQNAFSNIKIGSKTISADQKTDTLEIVAGNNISLTPDTTTDKITIAATDTTYASGDCITIGADNKINHNGITVSSTTSTSIINHGAAFIAITNIDINDFGHIEGINVATYTTAADWTKLDFYATSVHPATETANEYTVVTEIKDATHTANSATATAQYTTVKVPSKKYVDAQISASFKANDAMIYKGPVSKDGDLPYKACNQGWTYRVAAAGTYAGQKCEVGDMIICLTDGTSSVTGTWNVINNNIDGAIYTTATQPVVSGNFAAYDSTTGRTIKDSGFNTTSFATASHRHNITLTGSGDPTGGAITVVANGGDLSGEIKVTHKTYTSATFAQAVANGAPGTSVQFNVPTFTVDGYGHVENVSSSAITVTLPAKLQNPTSMTIIWKDASDAQQSVEYDGSAEKEVNLTNGIYYAATTSTAQYSVTAGHSVTAGYAITADKLNESAGSTTRPIFFHNGQPTQCSYSLSKSVPSTAVFTDTKNSAGSTALLDTKLFIVGAKTQAESGTTYSNTNTYIGSDNKLYAIGSASTTATTVITCNDAITNAEIDELF